MVSPMPLLQTRSRGLNIVELWFDEALPKGERPDIIRYVQAPSPIPTGCKDFYTILVNLSQDTDTLLAAMDKNTRYEIRRAEHSDGLIVEQWDRANTIFIKEFECYYNEFAVEKHLSPLNTRQIAMLATAGRLELSRCRDAQGEILVYHAYYRHGNRARLLHSASHFRHIGDKGFRALVGRANRFLHWDDMRRFKAKGIHQYDWGGWYEGKEETALLGINNFKQGFGGEVQCTYNGEVLVTRRARLFATLASLLGKR